MRSRVWSAGGGEEGLQGVVPRPGETGGERLAESAQGMRGAGNAARAGTLLLAWSLRGSAGARP